MVIPEHPWRQAASLGLSLVGVALLAGRAGFVAASWGALRRSPALAPRVWIRAVGGFLLTLGLGCLPGLLMLAVAAALWPH